MNTLADMQVRSIDHLGTLKDTGLPVFTTAWVHAHISTILRNPILDMCEPKETVEKIRAATPQFEMLVYELNSYSIPDILVHGDFHRENVGDLVDEQYYKFFDWSSALIGHPFCDFAVMFFSMEEPEIDEEEAEQAYFGGWKKYGDVQALRRAAHVALIAYFCLNLHTLEMDYERAGAVEQQSLLKLCTESMGTVLLQLQVLEDGDNSKDVSAT